MSKAALAALLAAALTPAGAMAQEPAPRGWSGQVTLYGWLPWIDGDLTAGPAGNRIDAPISVTPADLLDNLEIAGFANAEIRRGRLGFFGDVVYTALGDGATLGGPFTTRVDGDLTMALVTAGAAWRVWEDGATFLDLAAAARYVHADVEVVRSRSVPAPVERRASGTADWIDPMVGLRAGARLTDTVSLRAAADIGGFGVGSELSWELYAGAAYAFSDRFAAEIGFRIIDIDYEDDGGGADIDIRMYGPTIGLSYRF